MNKNVILSAVAALGKKNQIGLNGGLPWSFKDEYAHYKSIVNGHYVLIGRKNFEANEGDIEHCLPLVLTTQKNYDSDIALSFSSLIEVYRWAQKANVEKIFVIGGSEIYKLTLPYLSEFHLSRVDYDGEADRYFPNFDQYEWEISQESKHDHWQYQLMKKKPELLIT